MEKPMTERPLDLKAIEARFYIQNDQEGMALLAALRETREALHREAKETAMWRMEWVQLSQLLEAVRGHPRTVHCNTQTCSVCHALENWDMRRPKKHLPPMLTDPEWYKQMAVLEGDSEVGAGIPTASAAAVLAKVRDE